MEGLWRTGAGDQPELRESSGKLASTLKGFVKGRHEDTVVELSRLANESGLSSTWIFNAIESNLIELLHRKRGAQWEDRGMLVRIPVNFGMALIDHTADLRSKLRETENELEFTKEELKEYRCPICQAPMDSQNYSVPISEDVDGYVVTYACGRCDTDGYGAQPCPSDPKFPKFDEYDLYFKEQPSEPTWKWHCLAIGKTPMARQVSLNHAMCQTKEEALSRMTENYERIAKPWH
jgi:hypothetical protein